MKNLIKKFQKKLREEISNINKNLDISNRLYNAIIIKSKLEIYSFILEEALNLISDEEENNNYLSSIKAKKIINIVKDKLKENQNILFELVVNNKSSNKNIIYEETKLYNNNNENKNNKEKIISQSELISLLNEIYQHNIKQNEKNVKYNIPKISFINSINPYLITKYGLKSIALYWNNKIMEGINYYYKQNYEISIFKDILEGKIEESFYLNYIELKKTCSNIIYQSLKEKYPKKSNIEIDHLLNEKIKYFISYEDWTNLINNLLNNNNNNNELIREIIDFIKKKKKTDERYQNKNGADNNRLNILFNDFIKILLDI